MSEAEAGQPQRADTGIPELPRVLVVDDNEDASLLLCRLLRKAKVECDSVSDPRQAVELLRRGEHGCVLLDFELGDGYTAVEFMEALGSHPAAVVVVSQYDDDRAAHRAMAIGAQDYLCKDELATRPLVRVLRSAVTRKRLIGELERLSRDLEEQRDNAARTSDAKTRFLRTLSHELRSPVAAIRGVAQLLQRSGNSPDDEQRFAQMLYLEADHVVRLVDELSDLSRIEAGHISIDIEKFNAAAVVRQVVAALGTASDDKDLTIAVDVPNEASVRLDARILKQVVYNLVSNAIKYSRRGGEIAVALTVSEAELCLRVADEGVGIEADEIEHIFDEFYRARGVGQERGIGLGLPITKRLLTQLCGTISVESELHVGSTFTVTLPRNLATDGRALEVLIVEDDDIVVELATMLLEHAGVTVHAAKGVAQGLVVARELRPHLVLMDLNFPDGRGEDLAEVLRTHAHLTEVPFVAFTTDERNVRGDLAEQFDAWISKPIEPEGFAMSVVTLAEVLGRSRTSRQPPSPKR